MWRAVGGELHEVFREDQIERPVERDAHFLLKARQLGEVNRAPQKPRDETGELPAHNLRDAGTMPDGSQLADGRKAEGPFLCAADRRFDVAGDGLAFAQGMLRCRRVRLAGLGIGGRVSKVMLCII